MDVDQILEHAYGTERAAHLVHMAKAEKLEKLGEERAAQELVKAHLFSR